MAIQVTPSFLRPRAHWKEISYPNGWYIGEVKLVDGKLIREGVGAMLFNLGIGFFGSWKDDMRCGQGEEIDPLGYHAKGEWKDDKLNGTAIVTYPNGSTRSGNFRLNLLEGFGTSKDKSGNQYVGEWHLGKKEGRGTLTWVDGPTKGDSYSGEWRYDMQDGQGTYTYASGARYEGEFRAGKKEGRGVFYWPDGQRYDGTWKADRMSGSGTWTRPDGESYNGEWLTDKRHGHGIAMTPDGVRYEGTFDQGKRNGNGVLLYPNLSRKSVSYEHDKIVFEGPLPPLESMPEKFISPLEKSNEKPTVALTLRKEETTIPSISQSMEMLRRFGALNEDIRKDRYVDIRKLEEEVLHQMAQNRQNLVAFDQRQRHQLTENDKTASEEKESTAKKRQKREDHLNTVGKGSSEMPPAPGGRPVVK